MHTTAKSSHGPYGYAYFLWKVQCHVLGITCKVYKQVSLRSCFQNHQTPTFDLRVCYYYKYRNHTTTYQYTQSEKSWRTCYHYHVYYILLSCISGLGHSLVLILGMKEKPLSWRQTRSVGVKMLTIILLRPHLMMPMVLAQHTEVIKFMKLTL